MNESVPEQMEAVFRNGSVTVVGVIVVFSLTYLTSWPTNPAWQLHDLIGMAPLSVGVALQLLSLSPTAPHQFPRPAGR